MHAKTRNILLMVTAVGIFAGVTILRPRSTSTNETPKRDTPPALLDGFTSAQDVIHSHGLAVDVGDPTRLLIATHEGLFALLNGRDLYRIGKTRDDLMGFSAHPSDPLLLYSSGHPRRGGNIGFQKSADGGRTWTRVSAGANGPVDFHAMAVSAANPETIYGWYGSALQRSTDGGRNWRVLRTTLRDVIALTTHPTDANTVYAGTASGLLVSQDQGERWTPVSGALRGPVIAAAVDPNESLRMLAVSFDLGFARSADGGATWERIAGTFDGDIRFLAYDSKTSGTAYALTDENAVYVTADGGMTWRIFWNV